MNGIWKRGSESAVTVYFWAVHHAARSQASMYWGWNPASCRKATLNRPEKSIVNTGVRRYNIL
jgi:hypothetical protein